MGLAANHSPQLAEMFVLWNLNRETNAVFAEEYPRVSDA